MQLKYSLSAGNSKTGAMLLVRSPRSTCPDACLLKGNGCYAENFPLVLHWMKQEQTGVDFATVLYAVRTLPKKALWRLFEAGDFEPSPENPELISSQQVISLIAANNGKRGFGYTHYPVLPNLEVLQLMNASGLTINASADTFGQAKLYRSLGLPTTLLVSENYPKDTVVDGLRIIVCPNQSVKKPNGKKPQCLDCQLCQIADRDYVIGFRAHGTKKREIKVSQI
jgi:hypothetical protein